MAEDEPLGVAVIIGSTRTGRFGPTAAEWFAARARWHGGVRVDLVDLVDAGLPATLGDPDDDLPAQVRALAPRLAAADAFVVVTPEYNQSFPAPLKTAIDWFYTEWHAKPVGFITYGRESGGVLAAAQLRQVFAELHAVAVPMAVSLPRYWEQFAADGSWPKPSAEANTTVMAMLDQLCWWARALRDARLKHPYTA
ncbi:NAD(P)H-dependent FMN reductase [Murinocardiopsis flavida]|uniref:NAD(P)H-dependent FMN reductase n=1 Tax=Murinocardiopsis flavida TaxID=645275 RepID=A0A2P8CZ09_9ACTN|nr:NAD(P)H-dependent oxidoreductase [Murinocardiopsis flavida]PSK90212.1 NAD(P)H-dependent FMN reductase [Murinocardiopsis flavida]